MCLVDEIGSTRKSCVLMKEVPMSKNFGCSTNTSKVMCWNVFFKSVFLTGIMKRGNLGMKGRFSEFERPMGCFCQERTFDTRSVEIGFGERALKFEEC
jgi:hypothetical protein